MQNLIVSEDDVEQTEIVLFLLQAFLRTLCIYYSFGIHLGYLFELSPLLINTFIRFSAKLNFPPA
jgi:hypothetical protein